MKNLNRAAAFAAVVAATVGVAESRDVTIDAIVATVVDSGT